MIKMLIKFVIGVLAIPLAYGATMAFYNNIVLVGEIAKNMQLFVWGIIGYAIIHLLFYKPTYFYVLGHEAVHAGMAWIFGGKIKSFKVSEEGGSVGTDKSNVVIELGPYFIPLYTIIITLIYFVVAQSYKINGAIFIFLIGFTLSFHIISTIEIMKVKQPDIMKSGYLFSIVAVYLLNIIIVSLIFSLIFPGFSAKKFFVDLWSVSTHVYTAAIRQLFL